MRPELRKRFVLDIKRRPKNNAAEAVNIHPGRRRMAIFTEDEIVEFRNLLPRVMQDEDAYERVRRLLCREKVPEALQGIVRTQHSWIPESDIEDIVQDALIRAIDREGLRGLWENYGETADPEIWLRTKLRGKISDRIRSNRKNTGGTVISLDDWLEQGGQIPSPVRPLVPLPRQEFWNIVRECLGNDLDFQILWLKIEDELPGARIAELLCLSPDNVRQRFHYAMEKLRNCVEFIRCCEQNGLLQGGGADDA